MVWLAPVPLRLKEAGLTSKWTADSPTTVAVAARVPVPVLVMSNVRGLRLSLQTSPKLSVVVLTWPLGCVSVVAGSSQLQPPKASATTSIADKAAGRRFLKVHSSRQWDCDNNGVGGST